MLTKEDKAWLKSNCGKVERTGLYIMVFFIMLNSCSIEERGATTLQNMRPPTNIENKVEIK
jgi:hypothetical protein